MNIKGVNYSNYNEINSEDATCRTRHCSINGKRRVQLYYVLQSVYLNSVDMRENSQAL